MADVPAAIKRFLEGVQTANWDGMEQFYTPDAIYDATVPGWRYQYEGPAHIVEDLQIVWTGKHPWRIQEMYVTATADTVVIDGELRGRCPGDEHHPPHEEACRLANIFRLDEGRIAEHRFYCAGDWDEETLRLIEENAPKVQRQAPVP